MADAAPTPKADGRGKSPGSREALKKHAYRRGESGNPAGPKGHGPAYSAARLIHETYRAKLEKLEYEREAGNLIPVDEVIDITVRRILEMRNAVMAIGKAARSRIPHLTIDEVVVIESLCKEALEGLSAPIRVEGRSIDVSGRK